MNSQENIIDLLLQKKNDEAVDAFKKTPIFDYTSKSPLIKYENFEFSQTKNKNPIFLRILLNYISLINLVIEQNIENFQDTLLKFGAMFSYQKKENGYYKLILMAKSSIEVYNIFFQKGKEIFNNVSLNLTDIDWNQAEINSDGYTFQELAIIFVNDYVIGRDKGIDLPNILFYINPTKETQSLLDKIKIVPDEIKLDLNEQVDKSGVTEFDYIIKMNQDLTINSNNPYFRYIKKVNTDEKNNPVEYGELLLKENSIYIFEFKLSLSMNEKVARLENLAKEYINLYNANTKENNINSYQFTILYFYDNKENVGYRNFSGFGIDMNYWRFLYINPSCQILPVSKLSSDLIQLKRNYANLQREFKEEKSRNELMREQYKEEKARNEFMLSQINEKWKEKFGEDLLNFDKPQEEKYLQIRIENAFREKMDSINDIKSFSSFEELFNKFDKEMKDFRKVNISDKLKLEENDKKWKNKLQENIKDDDYKLCYEILAPCIGDSKASVNYKIIQNYIYNKIKKRDEMSEIYNYIYSCLYGNRTINSNASIQTFYKGASKKSIRLLQNIIKYTFYYDKKREGKSYYLLNLLKELVNNGNTEIHETMLKLKHKTLFELIFMTIVLFNSDNANYRNGFEYFPRK